MNYQGGEEEIGENQSVFGAQQAITDIEEIENREHRNVKAWAMEVKEDIERDGDNPRKLQEDWTKRANAFLSESYSRRWGDRN